MTPPKDADKNAHVSELVKQEEKRRYGEYMTPPDMDHHDRNCYLVYNLGKYKKEI